MSRKGILPVSDRVELLRGYGSGVEGFGGAPPTSRHNLLDQLNKESQSHDDMGFKLDSSQLDDEDDFQDFDDDREPPPLPNDCSWGSQAHSELGLLRKAGTYCDDIFNFLF